MNSTEQHHYVSFAGQTLIHEGSLVDVVSQTKMIIDGGETRRIVIIDNGTGHPIEIDFRGTVEEVLDRLSEHPMVPTVPRGTDTPRGPGRPKLGVVSREVTLLPRHWSWLNEQRGGASAALRRLVDEARKKNIVQDQEKRAIEAIHRVMWDMAGDFPQFEEASRALFAKNYADLFLHISPWAEDIRDYIKRLVELRLLAPVDRS